MVERLGHTLCLVLVYLIADDQKNWDDMLLHVIAADNNNVSMGTGLAPIEVHIDQYIRLLMATVEGSCVKGHESAKGGQPDYPELMRYRQVRSHELVREEHRRIKAKHQAANDDINRIMNNE